MFYTWACPRRPIGTSLGLDWDENSYLGVDELEPLTAKPFFAATHPHIHICLPMKKTGLLVIRGDGGNWRNL
jgi:hypothetical protein